MKRIDSPNRAIALFGAGKDGFKAAVPGVASATELTPAWFNMVQESLVRTIEAAGIELSAADYDQFLQAVQRIADQAAAVKVAALVNSSPAQLDTLNELAAALGNDANFAATMTAALSQKERKFDTGTKMLFVQETAPVGWTKVLTHDNKALRVVSGAAGSGGTIDFTAAFVNGNTGGTELTVAQMPAHNHDNGAYTVLLRPPYVGSITGTDTTQSGIEQAVGPNDGAAIKSAGGGQTHNHTINLDVKYVDVIIASKD